jgi:hypothetical protein
MLSALMKGMYISASFEAKVEEVKKNKKDEKCTG